MSGLYVCTYHSSIFDIFSLFCNYSFMRTNRGSIAFLKRVRLIEIAMDVPEERQDAHLILIYCIRGCNKRRFLYLLVTCFFLNWQTLSHFSGSVLSQSILEDLFAVIESSIDSFLCILSTLFIWESNYSTLL